MPRDEHVITSDDIISLSDYELIRKEKRQESILRKKFRRLAIGPHATIQFESWDSMWLQIQEMLRIEKGGDEQLVDELAAYNPMIPNGSEFTATLMFEIDEEERRTAFLKGLGGVDKHIHLIIGDQKVTAEPEQDIDRTRSDGKASAVQFLHFELTEEQVSAWKSGEGQVMVQIDHPNYGHAAIISDECRRDMSRDLD
ncbi:Protein of unknown function [Parasphingorhabdus marina DSM 22363]|uniref:DUF3501 domain-containing protein n=1 Tax=Parasphingorhabdus marina DSM 22363 TaxID=1123272 RepID=A0A1N6EW21_9SPHN|nr:DUF3501 family protein [Parasphingorhabdus marina]SIN87151.1 Protein of unknown function [Parasphingorhabdus marina DSM 22363]